MADTDRRILSYERRKGEFQQSLVSIVGRLIERRTQHIVGDNKLFYSHGRRWRHHSAYDPAESEMTEHSAEGSIKADDIIGQDPKSLWACICEIAESMSAAMHVHVFQAVTEGAESVGNVIDAQGKPFTPEIFIEALSKIDFSVNKGDGTVSLPTMHVGTELFEKMKALSENGDVSAEDRIEKIIKKKSEEALERERVRKAKFKNGSSA